MFCPQCGTNNEDGARFCLSCGRQLSDGTTTPQGNQGPAWRNFGNPEPPPVPHVQAPVPPPVPTPTYQHPTPTPQIVIGIPHEESGGGMWLLSLAMLVLVGAVAFAVIRVADVDTSSWPIVGSSKDNGNSAEVIPSKPDQILASLSQPCKDKGGQPCNVVYDLVGFRQTGDATELDYEVKATGTSGCSVDVDSDQKVSETQINAGKPGPFLEGARGRYYPLVKSTGFTANGGALTCDKTQKGTWSFAPTPGETALKLRHPSMPPARIDVNPLAIRALPPTDPLAVIPLPAGACTTSQNQPCKGAWELGPYGMQSDKSEILFFNVRYDGPPGCTINWSPDLNTHQELVRRGQKGIHLEVPGQPDLAMISGGGVAAQNQPQPCGQVLSGFWRFAPGTIAPTITFFYPDFPPVQIPIRP